MKTNFVFAAVAVLALTACQNDVTGPMAVDPVVPSTVVNSFDGTGFVGKGDVQLAFGWNNKLLQTNAGNVTFTWGSITSYAVTCEWTTETGGPNSKVIPHDVTNNKVATVSSSISYDARTQNQITGFILNGFGPSTSGSNVPAVGGSCPMAHATAVITSVLETGSVGGLFVNFGDQSVLLQQ